jgi:ATP-dependent Clp protease adaptor protein ClpS
MTPFSPKIEDEVAGDVDEEIVEPPMYKVVFLNDDYTTMEFVVEVLMLVFHKSIQQATAIMLDVHTNGRGVCGIYAREVAEAKVQAVHTLAHERDFPLKCIMEKE